MPSFGGRWSVNGSTGDSVGRSQDTRQSTRFPSMKKTRMGRCGSLIYRNLEPSSSRRPALPKPTTVCTLLFPRSYVRVRAASSSGRVRNNPRRRTLHSPDELFVLPSQTRMQRRTGIVVVVVVVVVLALGAVLAASAEAGPLAVLFRYRRAASL